MLASDSFRKWKDAYGAASLFLIKCQKSEWILENCGFRILMAISRLKNRWGWLKILKRDRDTSATTAGLLALTPKINVGNISKNMEKN